MSTTPLMSEFPEDKKQPLYPLDESDVELKVGGETEPRSRCGGCFWSRFRRRGRCNRGEGERKPRSPIRRAIRWFLTICLMFGLVGFFAAKHHHHKFKEMHPIICVPITETTTTVDLPIAPFTHLSLHPSLTSNDVKVTHSDKVANHTVSISFDLPEDKDLRDADDDAKYFVCHIAGPRLVSLGIHAKQGPPKDGDDKKSKHHKHQRLAAKEHDDHDGPHHPPHHPPHHHPHGPLIKATSTTVTFPAAAAGHPHSISFRGPPGPHRRWPGRDRFGHGCMKKQIKMAIAKAVREEKAAKAVLNVEEEEM